MENVETVEITAKIVPENERLQFIVNKMKNAWASLKFESFVYQFADECENYNGGYWEFVELSNGAFFMYPDSDTEFSVDSMNYHSATLDAESFGLYCSLMAMNTLTWHAYEKGYQEGQEIATNHYYALREYAMNHKSAKDIFALLD